LQDAHPSTNLMGLELMGTQGSYESRTVAKSRGFALAAQ